MQNYYNFLTCANFLMKKCKLSSFCKLYFAIYVFSLFYLHIPNKSVFYNNLVLNRGHTHKKMPLFQRVAPLFINVIVYKYIVPTFKQSARYPNQ